MIRRRPLLGLAAAGLLPLSALALGPRATHAATPNVLLVGTFNGVAGQYATIQDAVNAAQPGDWVLVAPGVYHEHGNTSVDHPAGVYITTPNLHLRGMDRNGVIVDGTQPNSGPACNADPAVQDFGPLDPQSHQPVGRNGIEDWKADGVSIENLTVCNYLSSADGGNGNEIWWNGGDGSGHIGLGPFSGQYISATDTYYHDDNGAMGEYGIFTSNERGPAVIAHTYSSNMGDSAYYIGACQDCNIDLVDAHAENSALGFSGTNSGGRLTIEKGEWDNNKSGIVPNALNNDDWPSPPDGTCPAGVTGPTGSTSCYILRDNNVHDNNNPNTPQRGIAGAAPVGTGIVLSGTQNDIVLHNTITNQKAYGIVVVDYPDTEQPPADAVAAGAACRGGTDLSTPLQPLCLYPAIGNEIAGNTFSNTVGVYNPGINGDIALAHVPNPTQVGDCFHDNTDTSGTLTSEPPQIQTLMGTCGTNGTGYMGPDVVELVCASGPVLNIGGQYIQCPTGTPAATYPPRGKVVIQPLPQNLPTMPDPCAGVPANAWCPATTGTTAGVAAASTGILGLANTAPAGAEIGAVAAAAPVVTLLAYAGRRRRRP